MKTLYELKNVIKSYGGKPVLNLDRLELEKGKIIGLLGPNGAGKTTLLEILAFLSTPDAGEMFFENERIDFKSNKILDLRRKVCLVQQQPILFTSTVYKNVAFPLKIRKFPKEKRDAQVDELLKLVGMKGFTDAKAHRLSGGETQRVAIAQALACFPQVILLDEPTANVDVENQITIERIIRDINQKRQISVIFTTHDMVQASRLANETVFMFEGKIASSTHENIFSGYVETDPSGKNICTLVNGLKLAIKANRRGPVRISIDPAGIRIQQAENPSCENSFRGKIIQIIDERSRIRILVDIGLPLSVLLPKKLFAHLSMKIGAEIWISCPYESIEVF
ncbi:MAG: ATP-binding cassette domain-containing protein [Deltaproteobacteria bacterium]|nr:ATP-binding cassette domain-containing protein [Deltaproteobacteria bacterium]